MCLLQVIVTGGVTLSISGQYKVTGSTELLDLATRTWTLGAALPRPLTGGRFLEVSGRPALLGRSGYVDNKYIDSVTLDI